MVISMLKCGLIFSINGCNTLEFRVVLTICKCGDVGIDYTPTGKSVT